jgi:hypothetical protein
VAWDPAVTAFILAGLVGGVGLVMNVSEGWELSHELSNATARWTALVVVRRYEAGAASKRRRAREGAVLAAHGYRLAHEQAAGPARSGGDEPVPKDSSPMILVTYHLD